MAESALDKLKRLAAERKQAATKLAQPASVEVVEIPETNQPEVISNGPETRLSGSGLGEGDNLPTGATEELAEELQPSNDAQLRSDCEADTDAEKVNLVEDSISSVSGEPAIQPEPLVAATAHPLAMEFAELETALLAKDPQFKTILRQIHRHLGQDPDLVTQMTEQEIQLIVGGLVVFANAEVVEPAKAKSVKAAVTAAKKKVISAEDL